MFPARLKLCRYDCDSTRKWYFTNYFHNMFALGSQMKLQLQKMHLGPPPLVLPIRRPEDQESRCKDNSLPCSPTEISRVDVGTQGTLTKVMLYPTSVKKDQSPAFWFCLHSVQEHLRRDVPQEAQFKCLDVSTCVFSCAFMGFCVCDRTNTKKTTKRSFQ